MTEVNIDESLSSFFRRWTDLSGVIDGWIQNELKFHIKLLRTYETVYYYLLAVASCPAVTFLSQLHSKVVLFCFKPREQCLHENKFNNIVDSLILLLTM